jgi:hypothetical protein
VLNFSEWQRPQEEATEAPEQVLEREMPLRPYLLLHEEARLSDSDRDRLGRGLAKSLDVWYDEEEGHEQ